MTETSATPSKLRTAPQQRQRPSQATTEPCARTWRRPRCRDRGHWRPGPPAVDGKGVRASIHCVQTCVRQRTVTTCQQHRSARPALPARHQRSSPAAPWRPQSQTRPEPTADLQGVGEAMAAVATETSKQSQLRRAAAASTHLRPVQQFALRDKINRAGPPYHAACPAGTRFSGCSPGTRCAAWA